MNSRALAIEREKKTRETKKDWESNMRPSDLVFRSLAVFATLVVVYYIGRPIYWKAEGWYLEYSEREAILRSGGDLGVVDGGDGERAALLTEGAELEGERIAVVDPDGTSGDGGSAAEIKAERAEAQSKLAEEDKHVQSEEESEGKEDNAVKGDGERGGEVEEAKGAEKDKEVGGESEGEKEKVGEGEEAKGEEEEAGKEVKAAEEEETKGEEPKVVREGESEEGEEKKQKEGKQSDGGEKEGGFARGVRAIIHEGRPLLDLLKRPIWEKPPQDAPTPKKEEFALRREMVEFRASNNVIVVTFANFAFMDFVTNWVRHLTEEGVFNILVGAMDEKILEGLFREGVPVFDMESGMNPDDAGWGSPIFHKMGREKVTLVNVFLSMNFELHICDTDVIWLRNPLPYMARYPEADVLTSSDNLVRTVDDDSLEHWEGAQAAFNIGILHFRPTAVAKRFARAWAELLAGDDKIWDQNGFNDILRKKYGPAIDGPSHLFWAFDGTLKMGVLPVSIFCSGHTYFVQRLYEKVGIAPYATHATFQFAGTEGKRHRFRESKNFYDPPEYYDPPGGIVSFINNIPEDLLRGGEHTLETHFKLINYQLKNFRAALAIALILGRTLVVPDFWCRFDRIWYPHNGILDGTDTPQPFLCPLDHIIELQKLLPGRLDEKEFGPVIPFREYSFLDNPRVPKSVLDSEVKVLLCKDGSSDCPSSPKSPAPHSTIRLPKNSRQNQILELLEPYKDIKIIQFSSMEFSFGGWDNPEMEKKFNWRLRHITGIWCCVNAHPGHIWYDFFASEKPDWKPLPPKSWQEDHPAWD